jgi:hypothetical protein
VDLLLFWLVDYVTFAEAPCSRNSTTKQPSFEAHNILWQTCDEFYVKPQPLECHDDVAVTVEDGAELGTHGHAMHRQPA